MVNRLKGESGQAMVEFVIVLPLLFALIFLLVYAGIGFNRQLIVTDAARVGARAGAVARFENPQTTPVRQRRRQRPTWSEPCRSPSAATFRAERRPGTRSDSPSPTSSMSVCPCSR
jgi:hypothetical protein